MVKVYLPSLRKPESNHSNYCNNYSILNKLSIITSTKTLTFLVSFEAFGTELARIGTGSHIKQKPEGISFGRTTNKYELWTELVKHFQLETPYLAPFMHNPADILIANFYPYNEFIAIHPRPFLRPSGETETIFNIGAIAPSLIGMSFEVLILKVISRIPICPNTLVGDEIIIVSFIQPSVHYGFLLLLGRLVVPRIGNKAHIYIILELHNELFGKMLIL